MLAVTSTGREADDLAAALRCLLPPDSVALYPGWETLPHERLSPGADTVGQRLAVLRRLAHPSRRRPDDRPAVGRRGAGALGAAAAGARPRRADAGRAARRRHRPRLRDDRRATWSGRLRPGRAGRAARRVRRPRRHPRRVPADRAAPAAGRVLGRGRRGDPLLQGRRPALARGRAARAVGAAVPRAAADRRRAGPRGQARGRASRSWPRCSTRSAAARRSRAWRRSRPSWSTTCGWCCTSCRPARTSSCATPSGSAPARPNWCARRPSSSTRRGPRPPAADGRRSISARRRCGSSPTCVADAARDRPAVVVDHARSAATGDDTVASAFEPAPMYHGDTDAALHDLRGWMRAGWQAVLVFEGHGSAERAVERLASAEIAGPVRHRGQRGAARRAGHDRPPRRRADRAVAVAGVPVRVRPDRPARGAGARQRPDAVAAAQRDRPARRSSRATTSCTSSTASAATSRWCAARSTAASAST